MKTAQLTILLAAALLAVACATPGGSECRDADWRQVGFDDGARGHAAGRIARHREFCAKFGVSPDPERYRDGHDAGLAQYCSEENGFRIGRAGNTYDGVCPAGHETRFLPAFRTGSRLHQLHTSSERMRNNASVKRAELERLEPNAQNLERLLRAGGISQRERDALRQQYNLLQSNITRLRTDARVLELEAAKLEAEYQRLEASHRYR